MNPKQFITTLGGLADPTEYSFEKGLEVSWITSAKPPTGKTRASIAADFVRWFNEGFPMAVAIEEKWSGPGGGSYPPAWLAMFPGVQEPATVVPKPAPWTGGAPVTAPAAGMSTTTKVGIGVAAVAALAGLAALVRSRRGGSMRGFEGIDPDFASMGMSGLGCPGPGCAGLAGFGSAPKRKRKSRKSRR